MAPGNKRKTKDIVSREYTINLHKALHGTTFKKRAPKAIKAVRPQPRSRRAPGLWLQQLALRWAAACVCRAGIAAGA